MPVSLILLVWSKIKMPEITINGQSVKTKNANTILEVAKQEGIGIPTLCHHDKLSNYGACRLCQVEVVSGQRSRLVASCTFPIEEGMVIALEPYVEYWHIQDMFYIGKDSNELLSPKFDTRELFVI